MKIYRRYLQTIKNFGIRAIDPFQDIRINGNYRFGDTEELDSLEALVLKELAAATPGKVKIKLKKIRELQNILLEFDKNYPDLYNKSKINILQKNELNRYLPFFDTGSAHEMILTPEYLRKIYQAVLVRQKSLMELINKTEDLLVDKKQNADL